MALVKKTKQHHSFTERIGQWAKNATLPGFEEIPVWEIASFLRKELKKGEIATHAKSVAFTFFLAVFPSVIFVFTLIPYIPVDHLQENLTIIIREVLPKGVASLLDQAVFEASERQRGGLLSIGFFAAAFIASNGMMNMMASFDRNNEYFKKRSAIKTRLIALQLTFVLFILLIFSLALVIAGNKLLIYLLAEFNILNSFNIILFTTLKFLIIFSLFFNSISVIYRYGPARKKRWKFISPGSTMATILSVLVSLGFSFFVNKFGGPSRLFGSLGTIMALQIWIYLNSFALLLGFELNSCIEQKKQQQKARRLIPQAMQ
ncbi:MAG: YihY/virulence factor BrkB family protein [Chitinophagales bacterium]|nr:YihY/virulence factor BrkB family protein [Chitinophagales bacterium]